MSTNNTEFISAIYQIASERGLEQDQVIEQIKKAYLTAYKKMSKDIAPEDEMTNFDVDIDMTTGEISVIANKKVVSVITEPLTQILESEAKLIDSRLRAGDHIEIDVTPDDFGRIAAQAALQRLMQGLRDAELETAVEKYKDKVGKIVTGTIQRKDQMYVRVEVERAEAIMPNAEQIPGEYYKSTDRKRFLLLRLSNTATDKRMVLSRASGDFLKALFEVEVPEISAGSVEIVSVAREVGSRSKVAVKSLNEKVDPIGSCVGPRGTRIDSVVNEIMPEKVDIILWSQETESYIINALSPAKVVDVKVDKDESYAKVLVAEDMLSLAIGKDGQNVRLAAKLTGFKIDITSDREEFEKEGKLNETKEETEVKEKTTEEKKEPKATKKKTRTTTKKKTEKKTSEIENLSLTERQQKLLKENKINSIEQIKEITEGKIEISGFTKRDIEKLKTQVS